MPRRAFELHQNIFPHRSFSSHKKYVTKWNLFNEKPDTFIKEYKKINRSKSQRYCFLFFLITYRSISVEDQPI